MAKNGVLEGDRTAVATKVTTENLKKELQRLVKSIVEEASTDEENGCGVSVCIDEATRTLQALKDLKAGIKRTKVTAGKRIAMSSFLSPYFFDVALPLQGGYSYHFSDPHRYGFPTYDRASILN